MNALVGERLSIITSKAQTTRHRIFGIVNGEDFQMVFSDTPGIIQPAYALQERMMGFVQSAFEDADILLYVVEPEEKLLKDERFQRRLNDHEAPLLIVINKIDLIDQEKLEELNAHWKSLFPKAEVIPLSALKKFNTSYLFDRLKDLLPEGPAYFNQDQLTDRSERFFASEIIREQILQLYDKEVPYSCEVEIESFKDTGKRLEIRANIHVIRDSQKGILIGHKGQALQRLADRSRKELKHFFDQTIFLDLYIKVSKEWRGNDRQLRRFGYNS
jgi:GTP-binding protein Era